MIAASVEERKRWKEEHVQRRAKLSKWRKKEVWCGQHGEGVVCVEASANTLVGDQMKPAKKSRFIVFKKKKSKR